MANISIVAQTGFFIKKTIGQFQVNFDGESMRNLFEVLMFTCALTQTLMNIKKTQQKKSRSHLVQTSKMQAVQSHAEYSSSPASLIALYTAKLALNQSVIDSSNARHVSLFECPTIQHVVFTQPFVRENTVPFFVFYI